MGFHMFLTVSSFICIILVPAGYARNKGEPDFLEIGWVISIVSINAFVFIYNGTQMLVEAINAG